LLQEHEMLDRMAFDRDVGRQPVCGAGREASSSRSPRRARSGSSAPRCRGSCARRGASVTLPFAGRTAESPPIEGGLTAWDRWSFIWLRDRQPPLPNVDPPAPSPPWEGSDVDDDTVLGD
jgi:hypothetical protein